MTLKVALLQMKVVDNKKQNLETAKEQIYEAAKKEAKLIILPEMFNSPYDNKFFPDYSEDS